MVECYICDMKISQQNKSKEHIFLNSIGGKLCSYNLICQTCNSNFGNNIDAELSEQLNYLANLLNISRDRGKPRDIVSTEMTTERKIIIQPGGKPMLARPSVQKEETGNKIKFSITARNKKEFRGILKSLKRKYPHFDIENANAIEHEELPEHPLLIKTSIGGSNSFRSICKTAINFYILNNRNKEYIKHLIPYIKNEMSLDAAYFYYPDNDIIFSRNDHEILHSIIIIGNKKSKVLYAYIEFFNTYKFVVLMSENYLEGDMTLSYFYDVISRKEIDKEFNLNISKDRLSSIVKDKALYMKEIKKSFEKVMQIVGKVQMDNLIKKIAENAIENSLKNYPNESVITQQMISELASEVASGFIPLIARNSRRSAKQS